MSSLNCQDAFWVEKPKSKTMMDCVSRMDNILTWARLSDHRCYIKPLELVKNACSSVFNLIEK